MKIKLLYDQNNLVFKNIDEFSNFDEAEKLRKLIEDNNLYLQEESNSGNFSFQLNYMMFLKKHNYINLMKYIFNENNEIIYDSNLKTIVVKIKETIKKINDRDNNIIKLFFVILETKINKWIEHKDILKTTPYEFQIEQASKLFNYKRMCNFSSPGSGKTLTTMLAVIRGWKDNKVNNLLVIGPKSAGKAWTDMEEILKHYKHGSKINCYDFSISKYKQDKLRDIIQNDQADDELNIIFLNYHKLQINNGWYDAILNVFIKCNTGLIIDECHYFKSTSSKKFERMCNLSQLAKYVYYLSGTPFPRGKEEGYYITNGLWSTINNDYKHEIENKIPFKDDEKVFKPNFNKIFVRIDKKHFIKPLRICKIIIEKNIVENYIDSKIKNILNISEVDFSFQQKIDRAILIRKMQAASSPLSLKLPLKESIEEVFEDDYSAINEIEESDTYFNIDPSNKDHEEKIENIINSSTTNDILKRYSIKEDPRYLETIKLLGEILKNKRVIIWNVFRKSSDDLLKLIYEKFPQRIVKKIDGSIDAKERDKIINHIKNSNNGILIASPATIAESISLHREIDYAIYFFRNYVGSHWMQSLDRIHRLVGQNEESREKTAFIIGVFKNFNDSIDILINKNLEKKSKIQEKLLNKKL